LSGLGLSQRGEVLVVVGTKNTVDSEFSTERASVWRRQQQALPAEDNIHGFLECGRLHDLALRDPLHLLGINFGYMGLDILDLVVREASRTVITSWQISDMASCVHDLSLHYGLVRSLLCVEMALTPWACVTCVSHIRGKVRILADSPVGVSSQRRSIPNAVEVIKMNGTMKETLQATCGVRPRCMTRESKRAGITK